MQCCPTGSCPSNATDKIIKSSQNVQLPPLKTFIDEVTKNMSNPQLTPSSPSPDEKKETKPISKRSLSKTTIACEHCRKHHRKCSGKLPCNACDKKGKLF